MHLSEAIAAKYDVSGTGKLDRVINRAIRTLPGGPELLAAIETTNAARNHAQAHRAADRLIVIDQAIDKLELIRDAMARHICASVGHEWTP
jgi:hypothetical protein